MPRRSRALLAIPVAVGLLVATSTCQRRSPPGAESQSQAQDRGRVPIDPWNVVGDPEPVVDGGAITTPAFLDAAASEQFLSDDDTVFVLRAREATFAFPRVFLSASHVVNTEIDGRPVLVSYCHLADAVRLHSRVADGRTLSFGWMRCLYNGTLVLADRETASGWVQFTGECFRGPLRGGRLEELATCERLRWRAARAIPGLRVLEPLLEVPACREFMREMEAARVGLAALSQAGRPDRRLDAYELGLGVAARGESRFVLLRELRDRGRIELAVGGWSLLAVADPDTDSGRLFRRVVDGRVLEFEWRDDHLVDEQTRSKWDLRGRCIEGALAGRKLAAPRYVHCYWFAWSAFYPAVEPSPPDAAAGDRPS